MPTIKRDPQGLRFDLWKVNGGRCAVCHLPINPEAFGVTRLTIDHRLARARGGNNYRSNLQPAHWCCNQWKGEREDPNHFFRLPPEALDALQKVYVRLALAEQAA